MSDGSRTPAPLSAWMLIGALSERVDVSADLLRKWERRYGLLRPRRSSGGYRLYSRADEARVRLMQRYLGAGVPPAQAAELAVGAQFATRLGSGSRVSAGEVREAHREMDEAFACFDETAAQRALERVFGAHTATAVLGDVLLPYMRRMGIQRGAAELSIAQEHFASGVLHGRLLALARGWDRGLGPCALLACAPAEQHVFGLISFGIALHQLGWCITYLGADTPVEVVSDSAHRVSPSVVVIAASVPERLSPHMELLQDLAERWPLMLAGPGVSAGLAMPGHPAPPGEDPVTAARHLDASTLEPAGPPPAWEAQLAVSP